MKDLLPLIAAIKLNSESLFDLVVMGEPINDLKIDAELGQIEGLIYTARQMISDEWRAARECKPFISHLDLEELGL